MPKRKPRRPVRQQPVESGSQTMPVKPWVRWVAIGIVAALVMSLLASLAATPAHAAIFHSTTIDSSNCVVDTDNDGIANAKDPDIDGDGVINANDNDIDGDGIDNAHDGDPAATNCNDDAAPPLIGKALVPNEFVWQAAAALGIPVVVIVGVAVTVVARRKKPKES